VDRLNELLARLIELQKADLNAEKALADKKRLPVRLQELEKNFQSASDTLVRMEAEFDEKQKQKKEKDRQLQTGQDMLKRARERLSDVKTNKEYQSLLKEIEISEKKNSQLEDEILSLLDLFDVLERENKCKQSEFDHLRRDYEEEKRKIALESGSLDQALDQYMRKGEQLKQEIPADLLKKYERIKTIGHGLAVVPVWKEVCGGCHMMIPPQMYNELQTSNEIMTCPNCNRIIYWEDKSVDSLDHN
jgi:uncharacterized protein